MINVVYECDACETKTRSATTFTLTCKTHDYSYDIHVCDECLNKRISDKRNRLAGLNTRNLITRILVGAGL
jgi:hypothetical protein